jgi:hypothetical protein
VADIRRDENKRESWWVTNNTKYNMAVGDLLLLPVIKPGKKIDVLRFYSREKISHSTVLASLLKSGKFSLNKQKIYTNEFPGPISIAKIDEAITPAEENEVTDVSDQLIEEVTPGQPITVETGGILLHGKDPDGNAQPIGISGEDNNEVLTMDLDAKTLLEDIYLELIKANMQMAIMTGDHIRNKDIGPIQEN